MVVADFITELKPELAVLGDIADLVALDAGWTLVGPSGDNADLALDKIGRASCRERVYHPV